MDNNLKHTVGEIVAKDFRTASVFSKYGIDFCCGGNETLDEACKKQSVDRIKLQNELDEAVQTGKEEVDFNSLPLDLLANYIEETYHTYIKKKSPYIIQFLGKIKEVHGEHHPELVNIFDLFSQSAMDLSMHLQKEERILFPLIRELAEAERSGLFAEQSHCGTIQNPISVMKDEHEIEGARFKKIAALSGGYTVPSDGCNTYHATYEMLEEFERKLHEHIHLENNILFPKAIELEKSFF